MHSAKMAASIVSSDFLSKAGTMYLGERVWNKARASVSACFASGGEQAGFKAMNGLYIFPSFSQFRGGFWRESTP